MGGGWGGAVAGPISEVGRVRQCQYLTGCLGDCCAATVESLMPNGCLCTRIGQDDP